MNFSRDFDQTERMIALAVGMKSRFCGFSDRPHHIGFLHDVYLFGAAKQSALVNSWVMNGVDNTEAGQRLKAAVSSCRRVASKLTDSFSELSEPREALILLLIFVYGPVWFSRQKPLIAALNTKNYGKVAVILGTLRQDKYGIVDLELLTRRWKSNTLVGVKRGDLPDGWIKGQRVK